MSSNHNLDEQERAELHERSLVVSEAMERLQALYAIARERADAGDSNGARAALQLAEDIISIADTESREITAITQPYILSKGAAGGT